MLAHELRNPMAPILSSIQLLQQETARTSPLAETIQLMERQVKQMSRLLDDLLDVSRIIHGKTAGKVRWRATRAERRRALWDCKSQISNPRYEI